jgi:hypothetical protein
VASFLNKLCHYATEAGEACGPTGAEKLPRKVQEVDAESWNYFYIFDIYYSKNQSLISGSNDAHTDNSNKYYNRWVIFTQIWQGNKLVNSTSSVAGCSKFKY